MTIFIRKPRWLKKRVTCGAPVQNVLAVLKSGNLHTVCEEARCPNCPDCFSRGTATFLILGDRCTRSCGFCAVTHDAPLPPDGSEPETVANAVRDLGLKYVVVTSVTRDDLPDGGAGHFAETIRYIRRLSPGTVIEVLIPDFGGSERALETVIDAVPDVIGHNLETVPRLYPEARTGAVSLQPPCPSDIPRGQRPPCPTDIPPIRGDMADAAKSGEASPSYRTSLDLLKTAAALNPSIPTKSGIMLGLGEVPDEVRRVLRDLLDADCSFLWLGQYLRPGPENLPVSRYVLPEEFDAWRSEAEALGFRGVASGPFVRSSYRAEELYGRRGQEYRRQEYGEKKLKATRDSEKEFGFPLRDEKPRRHGEKKSQERGMDSRLLMRE